MSWMHAIPQWTGDYGLEGIELGERVAVHATLEQGWDLRRDNPEARWIRRYRSTMRLAQRQQERVNAAS